MPCYDAREDEPRPNVIDLNPLVVARLDLATRLLCDLLTSVEKGENLTGVITNSPALLEWWQEHKKMDAQRKRRL